MTTRRLFILIGLIFAFAMPKLVAAQSTSITWTFAPGPSTQFNTSNGSYQFKNGGAFSIAARLQDTYTNAAITTGFAAIDRVQGTGTTTTICSGTSCPAKVAVTPNGSVTLTGPVISDMGSYTVDVCYYQTATSGCIVKGSAFVVVALTTAGGPNISISWDKTSYAIGDKPRLTVIVRDASSNGLSGVCVSYDVKVGTQSFANNTGVCGTADMTDASGSATWLLPAVTQNGSYSVGVNTSATVGYTAGSQLATLAVGTAAAGTAATTGGTASTAAAAGSSDVTLPNPISCNDATCLISQLIRYILGIIAIIATLMFIWGGVMMLTSGGNADQLKKAKETLVWATIGVALILLSWVIIKFVLASVAGTSS